MKHFIAFLTAVVAWIGAAGQFSVGVGYGHTIGGTNSDPCYNIAMPYVSYQKDFKNGFALIPEIGIYGLWGATHDYFGRWDDGSQARRQTRHYAMGVNCGIYVSKKIFGQISVLTGPEARCNFYQGQKYRYNPKMEWTTFDFPGHRAALLWKIGCAYEFDRLKATVYYDAPVTKQFAIDYVPTLHVPTYGVLGVSISYKL